MGDRTNQDLPPRQFFFENGSELIFWLTFMVIWRPGLSISHLGSGYRIQIPIPEPYERVPNFRSACRTSWASAEPMSAGEPHEHGRIASAWENLMSIEESHGNGRTPMRIWRSQRSHFPLHRSFFCFRYVVLTSSLIQFFSIVLDVRHLPWIMVLIQYASAWENVVSMGEPHEHGRIAWEWENPMRIWGSQRSHFPRHHSFFCFRFCVSFVSPSASSLIQFFSIVLNVRHLPSNRGLDSECISMGERREHRRTSWASENRMRMGEPHAHMAESTESLSASSLILLLQVRRLLHP